MAYRKKEKPILFNDKQMRQFVADGYVIFKPDVPGEVHKLVHEKLKFMEEEEFNCGNNVLPRVPEMDRVLNSPEVRGALISVLGPGYIEHPNRHSHFIPPGREPVPVAQKCHQDGYTPLARQRQHYPRFARIMYYPQDSPVEIGPTHLIPGSYGHKMLPEEDRQKAVPIPGEAGTVCISHFDIGHGAGINKINKSRAMIKFMAIIPLTKAGKDRNMKIKNMHRIDISFYCRVSVQLNKLSNIPEYENIKIKEIFEDLVWGHFWLNELLNSRLVPLRTAIGPGTTLLDRLKSVINRPEDDLALNEITILKSLIYDFVTVLSSEWRIADIYWVAPKGAYSTRELLEKADVALDEKTRAIIPDNAIKDFNEAGRALAFELPTAVGFHMMRATEAVLIDWHQLAVDEPSDTKEWGAYIKELKDSGADENTVSVIDQIRKLHRNPLMHPEAFLDIEAALGLFDIAKSAIVAMAKQIISLDPERLEEKST